MRSRCADVPDPAVLDWHLAPWPSFVYVEESGRDRFAEAALGSSSSHNWDRPRTEPANPKTGADPGRRRSFWWRDDGDMPLSQSSDRKAGSIDPANVFGAADADADFIRKLAVAADGFDSSDVPATRKEDQEFWLIREKRPEGLKMRTCRPLLRVTTQLKGRPACPRAYSITASAFAATVMPAPTTSKAKSCSRSNRIATVFAAPRLRFGPAHLPWRRDAALSQLADRRPTDPSALLGPSRRMPRVRPHSPGLHRLRRSASPLHACLRTLRPGPVRKHDHQGRGRPSRRRLGRGQGHPEAAPAKTLHEAQAQASASAGRRRDLHRRRTSLPSRWCSISKAATSSSSATAKRADALDPFWRCLHVRRERRSKPSPSTCRRPTSWPSRRIFPRRPWCVRSLPCRQTVQRPTHDFRRELQREAEEGLHKDVLKGTRWLLLKNPENLDPKRRERERLEEALPHQPNCSPPPTT